MRRVVIAILVSFVVLLQSSVGAEPVPVPTEIPLPTSPIIITAYQASIDGLSLVQIYNSSDDLVDLKGMSLGYSSKLDPAIIATVDLSGIIEPGKHVLIASIDTLVGNEAVALRFAPNIWEPKAIWIDSPTFAKVTIPSDVKTDDVIYKRSRTSTGYSTAASSLNSPLASSFIEADPLYEVPPPPLLKINEIYTRASDCSPFDESVLCGDYIKLLMLPGFNTDDLIIYRLRAGGSPSVTNTFSLVNASIQGQYLLLRLRDDGASMSLSNTGGYIWLEDLYGVAKYKDSLVQYPSASAAMYIGWSWAFNTTTGDWQWTTPSPLAANTFSELSPEAAVTPVTCAEGKYLNQETGRCRTIEQPMVLEPCGLGKERNPATNRCRSIVTTAVATLTPCKPGQERNPATNRCRSVASSASSLTPCAEGQERNPETNRCRKVTNSGQTLAKVTDVKTDPVTSSSKWLIAGAVGLLAVGYAVYEWRSEFFQLLRRLHIK